GHPRGGIIKIDFAAHTALGHLLHNDRTKPAPLRWRHRRPIALRPAHYEGLALGPPADIQTTRILRESPVFSGVGGKFVKREPYGLRRGGIQTQLRAAPHHPTANVIRHSAALAPTH